MNHTHAFSPPNLVLLQALNKSSRLLRRLDAALQRRVRRRAEAAAGMAGTVPHALLGLWAASQGAMMAAPSDAAAARDSSGDAPAPSLAARVGRALWRALERAGARRARSELLGLACQHEASRPEFAARLREAARRGWL